MEANVFICHNPFHFYISSQICREKFASPEFENWIVSPPVSSSLSPSTHYLITKNGIVEKVKNLWKIKAMITKLAVQYGPKLHIFLPHTDGIIGNYVFESSFMKKKDSKINLYYEGIVMLDENRMEREFPRFIGQKKLLSLSIFHWFVKHNDILPLDSPRIHKVFTPYAAKTPAPKEKIVEISFQRENISKANGGVLIVGVDAGESLSESSEAMIQFFRQDGRLKKFYFKPHYADRAGIFEKVAAERDFLYQLVQDTRCIEELMGDLEVEMVICTHLSSALLNLKMIYKNDLRVVFLAHPKTIVALGDQNITFASGLGVEIKILNQL
jgi:hypothetical protein